jgi:hypothetical protein
MTLDEWADGLRSELQADPSKAPDVARRIVNAKYESGQALSDIEKRTVVERIARSTPPRSGPGMLKEADDQRHFLEAVRALRAAIEAAASARK